jgi:type II secretory pathway pseudopilin PulG
MRGITLIETLIYISLLSILMVGIFSSVYVIIDSAKDISKEGVRNSSILLQKFHE